MEGFPLIGLQISHREWEEGDATQQMSSHFDHHSKIRFWERLFSAFVHVGMSFYLVCFFSGIWDFALVWFSSHSHYRVFSFLGKFDVKVEFWGYWILNLLWVHFFHKIYLPLPNCYFNFEVRLWMPKSSGGNCGVYSFYSSFVTWQCSACPPRNYVFPFSFVTWAMFKARAFLIWPRIYFSLFLWITFRIRVLTPISGLCLNVGLKGISPLSLFEIEDFDFWKQSYILEEAFLWLALIPFAFWDLELVQNWATFTMVCW